MKVLQLLGVVLFILCWPIWRWIGRMYERVTFQYKRRAGSCIQTPVIYLRNPKTDKKVVLMGMVHIGRRAYYAELAKKIEKLESDRYAVLYERVIKMTPQESETLSTEEQAVCAKINGIMKFLVETICPLMYLQHQREGFAYPDRWINTDMKEREVIRLLTEEKAFLLDKEVDEEVLGIKENPVLKRLMRWVLNKLFSEMEVLGLIGAVSLPFSKEKRALKRIILDMRDDIALVGINEHIKTSDVLSIWGAAHLRGIVKGLKKQGFVEEKREWVTAYKVRPYKWWWVVRKFSQEVKKNNSDPTAKSKNSCEMAA